MCVAGLLRISQQKIKSDFSSVVFFFKRDLCCLSYLHIHVVLFVAENVVLNTQYSFDNSLFCIIENITSFTVIGIFRNR
jgi:hypothetical protein